MAHVATMLPARHLAPATLEVTLLGAPRLTFAGQPVVIPRRQTRALFYRLAATAQPVARDQLCFLLWPDAPDQMARRNLTVLLAQLRRVLPVPDLFESHGDAVGINQARLQADTIQIATLVPHALATRQLETLADAAERYHGPFLAGFSLPAAAEFDTWAEHERQVWERRYLDILAALVEGYTTAGVYQAAIAAAQRALATDELAEDMHRRLIELYAATGDRAAAQRQFERCVAVLERELGVAPLPETRAVYEALRDAWAAGGKTGRPETRDTRPETGNRKPETGDKRQGARSQADKQRGAQPVPVQAATRLPVASTPLIGRERELAQAQHLLADPAVRLLTLYGPGGSGKTRLALQLAWEAQSQFADGAIFVNLAPLRDPALLLETLAQACGIHERSTTPLPQVLGDFLSTRQVLLVIDNCEHLLPAIPLISELIAAAPAVRVLATSRSLLGIHCEHTLAVPPLPLPDLAHLPPLTALVSEPAIALLLTRTRALAPRFALNEANAAALAAICVRLDGLPLALELAAARLKVLTPEALLKRLDHRLALLTGGASDLPGRQQTLRATIDWSYRLLDAGERALFDCLAVFAGGWTLEAAEEVLRASWQVVVPNDGQPGTAHADLQLLVLDRLAALVDKSLVQPGAASDEPRFEMLETIREYALERLYQRGSCNIAAQAHASYYLKYAEGFEQAVFSADAPAWISRLDQDYGNLRAALGWYLGRADGAQAALRLGAALGRFWHWRSYYSEGRQWLELILTHSQGIETAARAEVLFQAAQFAGIQGDNTRAIALYQASLSLSRALDLPASQAAALGALGAIYNQLGDVDQAIETLEQAAALARQIGNPQRTSAALDTLAAVLVDQCRDVARGISLHEEALAIAQAHQLYRTAAIVMGNLGLALTLTGDYQRAADVLTAALEQQRQLNATMSVAWSLQYLGMLAYVQHDYRSARLYFHESLAAAAQAGGTNSLPMSLEGLAGVAAGLRRPLPGARLLGAAAVLRNALGSVLPPIEQPYHQRIVESIQAQVGPEAFAGAWQAGQRLTTEQALAEAAGV